MDGDLAGLQPGGPDPSREQLSERELDEALALHETFIAGRPGGRRAVLQFHDLSSAELSGRNLREIELSGAGLGLAVLRNANLSAATLYAADLRAANLTGADLSHADLRGACLRGAKLTDAKLIDADLREGRLSRYDRNREAQNYGSADGRAELSCIAAERADFSGAKAPNAFMIRTDLTDAILRDANFEGADMRRSMLVGATLTNTNLTGAQLAGASLQGADLTGAMLMEADLTDADLRGAVLDMDRLSARQRQTIRIPACQGDVDDQFEDIITQHSEWVHSSGLRGKRADLRDLDLSERALAGINLAVALLERASMRSTLR